jgi:hypothetical protein
MKQSTGEIVFRILFALVFMALGAWVISMAIKGETPAQLLDKPGDSVIMGIFGGMFCMIGVLGIAYTLLSGSATGRTVLAGFATVVMVLSGLCFLSIAILQPGEIESTSSVNGVEVSRSKGGISGPIVFGIVGVLPIIFVRQVFRGAKNSFAEKKSRLPD